ncbi:alpha/beta hydrolase [Labrenzia sp. DG1229]|uniref:alpha/beta fold hydrolase n=1 Tax=Labrenzia sp. DG1229 TaxID=681847 RepID=UPI0006918A7B|nr:alpha/beta hydrolase [Labrenzia sp. DG1229]
MKIVILPGLDGTGYLLETFAQTLSGSHGVEVVSYPTEKASYADLKTWLAERLPQDPYVIIAESFSGPLAIELATKNSLALRGVVFVASFARSPRPVAPWMISFLKLFPHQPKLLARLSKPFVIGRAGTDHFNKQYAAALRSVSLLTLINRLQEVLATDLRSSLLRLSLPCLYLRAHGDLLVPASVSMGFEMCSAEYQIVKGPHFLLQAEPELTASLVLDFIEDLLRRQNPGSSGITNPSG